jgi:hypothetical protein
MSVVNRRPFRFRSKLFLVVAYLSFLSLPAVLPAQTVAAAPGASITPGPKPADAPPEWKQLVGIYSKEERARITILERDGQLFLRAPFLYGNEDSDVLVQDYENSRFSFPYRNGYLFKATADRDLTGNVTMLTVTPPDLLRPDNSLKSKHSYRIVEPWYFPRADAGADPTHFFHVTPTKPVEELRAAARVAKPPEEAGPFRKAELVELITLDPAIHLDIRYARHDNFLSTPLYTQARAFLQRPAAEALLRVLRKLQPLGYGLLIHDAYRPWYITKLFWDATDRKSVV